MIVSVDPGTKNYYLALYKNKKCQGTMKVDDLIFDLKTNNLDEQYTNYKNFWDKTLKKVDTLVIERFQNRGIRTLSVELISFMNGILYQICCDKKIDFVYLTAATWKNKFNKENPLYTVDSIYERAKDYGLVTHQVDAALIGLYHISKFKSKFSVHSWLKSVERSILV